MTFKYYGSLESLQNLLTCNGVLGTWEPKPNGVHMLRMYNRSNLHWAETKKTLWFSGKEGPKQALAVKVEKALLGIAKVNTELKAANDDC